MTAEPARGRPGTSPLGRYAPDDDSDLVTVRLLGVPVGLWCRSAELHDELMREFSLLSFGLSEGAPRQDHVPVRLLELVRELRARYGGNRGRDDASRQQALLRGDRAIDLVYEVPRSLRDVLPALLALLEEADEYCRSDSYLLTLAPDQAVVDFRRWFLGEFERQSEGAAPSPWTGPLD